jgi:hypothetical protein
MRKNRHALILIDGIINLLIGLVLLLFPWGTGNWLGLPIPDSNFYPVILGAVIFGIGLALMLEWKGPGEKIQGLGLEGAITINFMGGGVLFFWLVLAPFQLPLHGIIILWTVALTVLIVGLVELLSRIMRQS